MFFVSINYVFHSITNITTKVFNTCKYTTFSNIVVDFGSNQAIDQTVNFLNMLKPAIGPPFKLQHSPVPGLRLVQEIILYHVIKIAITVILPCQDTAINF